MRSVATHTTQTIAVIGAGIAGATCASCGLAMTWRRHWAKNWAEVKDGSDACRRDKAAHA